MAAAHENDPPEVDVVIAVHDRTRPIARAVASALRSAAAIRVTVVGHGLSSADVSVALGAIADDRRVRILPFEDGVRSPAGPFNAGIAASDARFVSIMGSDDELEEGAVDGWLSLARQHNSDIVIPRLRHADGETIPTPPTRPHAPAILDPVRDRLAYRTAPLGLIRGDVARSAPLTLGLSSGEDLEYGLRLWFSGRRIVFDRAGKAYIVHADADTRVTTSPRAVRHDLAALTALRDSEFWARASGAERAAITVKLYRLHIFAAVANRDRADLWTESERADLAAEATALRGACPRAELSLSIIDRRLLDAVSTAEPASRTLVLSRLRKRRLHPLNLVTRSPFHLLDREGPLRFAAASVLAIRRRTHRTEIAPSRVSAARNRR